MLDDSRARLLVVSEELLPKFAKAIARVRRPRARHRLRATKAYGQPRFEDLLRRQPNPKPVTAPTTRDDICFWLYTSGSTGKPKGAVHTHADLKLTDDLYAAPILGITENDICYSVAKLFFAYGLGNALTFPMSAGATTVLLAAAADAGSGRRSSEKAPGHDVLSPCRRSMPPFSPARRRRNDPTLKLRRCVSAGEALPTDIGRRWSERYGVDILDGLGSTEMLHIFLTQPRRRRQIRHHRQAGAGLRRPPGR